MYEIGDERGMVLIISHSFKKHREYDSRGMKE